MFVSVHQLYGAVFPFYCRICRSSSDVGSIEIGKPSSTCVATIAGRKGTVVLNRTTPYSKRSEGRKAFA